MSAPAPLLSPRQAVKAMIAAGADFTVEHAGTQAERYAYRVRSDGDADRCRDLLAAVKKRPRPFLRAFYAEVFSVTIGARA